MKLIINKQKAKALSLSQSLKLKYFDTRFTGCLARDVKLPAVSVIKSTERFIRERKLSPRMTLTVFSLFLFVGTRENHFFG